ncbi:MAG: holliday junction resolvase [Bacteriophage sp.]|jgi:Holliday junction resolvase|nr:MAG: holliday junction resolvase [Bacteriophage sp.]DAL54311.1 MAG TPA_asm: HOLLIDAY JUNCTION RESOLVASE HOMOLOGOUS RECOMBINATION [Caudoviricetes sp.]UVX60357.1 MAG: holliday junction resolvase [Bacteriophage sp.]UVX66706.1 MAG: holliday junction resolvase [Bacteriophage sp.]UWD63008.1 MAG: holliday junction resolvase [Bacteriophage sp.]
MAVNSRRKGKEGELELARILRTYGFDTRRGQQFKGGGDSPDVMGLPGVHIECKRVQNLVIEKAMVQSRTDAEGTDDVPVVMHRRDREKWKVTMDLDEFMKMYIAATDADVPRFPTCALHKEPDIS